MITIESIEKIKLFKNSSLGKNFTLNLIIQIENHGDKLDFSIFKTRSIWNNTNTQWYYDNPFNLVPNKRLNW